MKWEEHLQEECNNMVYELTWVFFTVHEHQKEVIDLLNNTLHKSITTLENKIITSKYDDSPVNVGM